MSLGGDPLERLVRVAEEAAGEDVRASTFVRGLAIGALVGAAIAGSTIWQRRRRLSGIFGTSEAPDAEAPSAKAPAAPSPTAEAPPADPT